MKIHFIFTILILLGLTLNISAQESTAKEKKPNEYKISKIKSNDSTCVKEIKVSNNEKTIKNESPKLPAVEIKNEIKPISKNKFFKYYLRLAKGEGNFA
jgi:hypothetical protein